MAAAFPHYTPEQSLVTEIQSPAPAVTSGVDSFRIKFASFELPNFDIEFLARLVSSANFGPSYRFATRAELDAIQQKHPLPDSFNTHGIWGRFRFRVFSTYRRLFTLLFGVNLTALIIFLVQLRDGRHASIVTPGNAATAAAGNFCVGILMRNEHVVNGLFRTACSLPVSTPIWIRKHVAKVYSYGGIHSGCGVSGTMWYLVLCGLAVSQIAFSAEQGITVAWEEMVLATTAIFTVLLLILILVFAHPQLRIKVHNQFETVHRYAGWTVIACLWVQTVSLVLSKVKASQHCFPAVVLRTPPFWFLVVSTLCIIYPWTRLRLRKVHAEKLSDRATTLHFNYLDRMETGQSVRLTHNPLKETHSFATFPNSDGQNSFSALVSNAGDWTNDLIRSPRQHIFVKGAPTIGVIRIALLFKNVLIITTGSGIGPCLSLIQASPEALPRRPIMRVIWCAANPLATFRRCVINSVFKADPNAIIVDTKQTGRGDLLALSYSLFIDSGAEAAVVISNPRVTKTVVHGLELCGVPAFGPIFDS